MHDVCFQDRIYKRAAISGSFLNKYGSNVKRLSDVHVNISSDRQNKIPISFFNYIDQLCLTTKLTKHTLWTIK